MTFKTKLRRLWFGLATVLGFSPRGYFIPYRYAADLPGPGHRPSYGAIERLFDGHQAIFQATLDRIGDHKDALLGIGADDPAPGPRWHQDWFPRLDAAVAYAMVRAAEPARIIEVGSGHSTRFLARAITDGGLTTRLTAIDPAPRAAIQELGSRSSTSRSTAPIPIFSPVWVRATCCLSIPATS